MSAADDHDHGDEQERRTSGVSVRKVPAPAGATRLVASEPATAERREQRHEAAEQHGHAAEQVGEGDPERAHVAGRVRLHEAGEAGERRAVVVRLRGVGVEASRRTPAGRSCRSRARRTWWRSPARWPPAPRAARPARRSCTSFTSRASIFLPRYSGVRPDHQPGDEHRQQDHQQHPVEPRADPAEDHLAGRSC